MKHEEHRKKSELIKELKNEKTELSKKINVENLKRIKAFHIRNLKIFGRVCTLVTPFALSAGLTAGAFKLFGGGYPFYIDTITAYKTYNLIYDDEKIEFISEYMTNNDYLDNGLQSYFNQNNIVICYTPWEEKNGKYIRYKREYELSPPYSLEFCKAVLNDNYEFIYNYINTHNNGKKEEKQIINSINKESSNDYIFHAKLNLHLIDKNDTLLYSETDLKNIIITIVEVILGLGIGTLITSSINHNYFFDSKLIKAEYLLATKAINTDIKNNKQRLKEIKRRIKELKNAK